MKPNLKRSVRLLKYRSKSSFSFGMEVVFDAGEDLRLLLEDLDWLYDVSAPEETPDFFVMELQAGRSLANLRALAKDAVAHGLAGKLCLVASSRLRPPDSVLAELNGLGMRILLGDVGPDARFSDLTDSLVDGIVIDRVLVSRASGDAQSASVLEAIARLAANLGLRTFANRCHTHLDLEVAMSCGVEYLTLEDKPPIGRPTGTLSQLGLCRTVTKRAAHR